MKPVGIKIKLASIVVLVSMVIIFHPFLFRLALRPLFASGGSASGSTLVILGGDRRYTRAAQLVKEGAVGTILLNPGPQRWVVEYGIAPAATEIAVQQLVDRGVPSDRVTLLPGGAQNLWEVGDQLATWLAEHPNESLMVLVDQLYGRTTEIVLQRTIPAEVVDRVQVVGLKHRQFNAARWWRERRELKMVFNNYAWLAHTYFVGRPAPVVETWNPVQFERRLRLQMETG